LTNRASYAEYLMTNTVLTSMSDVTTRLTSVQYELTNTVAVNMTNLVRTVDAFEAEMSNTLASIMGDNETAFSNLTQRLGSLIGGLASGMDEMGNDLQAATDQASATLSDAISAVQARLGGEGFGYGPDTLAGQVSGLVDQMNRVQTLADDAASNGQGAKSAVGGIMGAMTGLKNDVARNDIVGAMRDLDTIKARIGDTESLISQMATAVQLNELYSDIESMASSINTLAESKGFKNLLEFDGTLKPAEGEGKGDGLAGDVVDALNRNMAEVKSSMELMRRVLDDMAYEPVIQEELRGLE